MHIKFTGDHEKVIVGRHIVSTHGGGDTIATEARCENADCLARLGHLRTGEALRPGESILTTAQHKSERRRVAILSIAESIQRTEADLVVVEQELGDIEGANPAGQTPGEASVFSYMKDQAARRPKTRRDNIKEMLEQMQIDLAEQEAS